MAQYCNAFKMETDENKFGFAQNPDSFESWQGRRGPYYTPVVSADGTLSWVNNGGLPNPQPVNIAGPPGQGLEIQGVVETMQQLPAGAAQGDVWLVGTDSPYEAYIWVSGGWLDLGQVAVGPQGPEGEPGTDGVSPEVTVTEISGGHRVTITDADGTEAFDVLDGEDGAPGSPGAPGAPGAAGSDGTTFTPSVSAAGVISWTNDGGKTNPDPVNIKGPQGDTGSAGAPGAAATIAVGTVSGLPAGSTPTVTNSGSSSAAVFNFGIPAGADGATGPTGPAGPGVPTGGAAGQVLAKASGTAYDTEWIDPPSGGGAALYFTAVACAATTGDFATVSNAAISADTVIAEAVFANPSAITSDVTWTTSAGQLALNGTCSTATTVNLVLVDKIN